MPDSAPLMLGVNCNLKLHVPVLVITKLLLHEFVRPTSNVKSAEFGPLIVTYGEPRVSDAPVLFVTVTWVADDEKPTLLLPKATEVGLTVGDGGGAGPDPEPTNG